MLILGLGTFEGLPEDPGPLELIQYGFATEFASRWSVILSLGSLTPNELVVIFRRGLTDVLAASADFGYDIRVPDPVLLYVAQTLAAAGPSVTPRAGVGWLRTAVDSVLLRLLDLEARPGLTYAVQADDVPVPASVLTSRGRPNKSPK